MPWASRVPRCVDASTRLPTRDASSARGDAEHSILSALAAKGGIYLSSMDGSYEAIALDSSEARLLRQRAGSPALRLVRTSFATNGMPYEVALTIFRADRYQLRVRSDDGVDSFRKVML
ncbi:UTRA domain-containing protein [Olsenella uli]|uniref:UTRA domain-containing protein n=1 Tax=Olsenella uli TaxID=133926 RepID=UPI0028D42504|nr:UTRA domain-containing protein [Olsenella uli]